MKVYVAYAHHFNGCVIIIGVYYNPDDAASACQNWENEHVYCDWTEWESYEVK